MSIVNIFKGFFIGIALVVPGLSGSIFAVIVGLYEKILNAIANFKQDIPFYIKFLFPIAIGVGIGILASASAILWISTEYPVQSYLFFSGLVIGSFPLILRKTKKIPFNPLYLVCSVVSFFLMIFMAELGGASNETQIALYKLDSIGDIAVMIFAGVFSVSFMVIPGISGSIMLMVVNHYGTVYNAVSESTTLLRYAIVGNWDGVMESMSTVALLIPFAIGALVGIVSISKLMLYLLNKNEPLVYYCVGGALVAAIVTLFQIGVVNNLPVGSSTAGIVSFVLIGIVCIVAGILCTNFIDKPEKVKE